MQHAYDGSLWLFDLHSSPNRTKINEQPVQPQFFQQLLPGNSIMFGRSKRIYVVRYGAMAGNGTNATPDSFVNMAASAIESGKAFQPTAKNHYSNLSAALRSAADGVRSPSKRNA